MEKIKLQKNEVQITRIELNENGEYASVSTDDPTLFDRFASGYKKIIEIAEAVPAKLDEIEKKYGESKDFDSTINKTLEMSHINVDFSKEAVNIVDGIFGSDTIKKYFRNCYEEIPDFVPDVECFVDFLEKVTPLMEKLFNRKIEDQNKRSKERMAKYQPQDFKKPRKK